MLSPRVGRLVVRDAPSRPSGYHAMPLLKRRRQQQLSTAPRSPDPSPSDSPISGTPISSKTRTDAATSTSLPSHDERSRSLTSKRFSRVMDNMQSNLFLASRQLNDLTGYSSIEALKHQTEALELTLEVSRTAVRRARNSYQAAVSTRSASQREVNDLLQRKHTWTGTDLERFTELYRSDHANEAAESKAKDVLAEQEREVEDVQIRLGKSILERYHEEQIWSDKIRRMSTWGTWGLMAVNVLLFLVFQVAVEPWRRARLVRGFEEKVQRVFREEKANAADDSERAKMLHGIVLGEIALPDGGGELSKPSAAGEDRPMIGEVVEHMFEMPDEASASEKGILSRVGRRASDLWSDKLTPMRMLDVTTIAIESAVTGAALAATIAFFISRS